MDLKWLRFFHDSLLGVKPDQHHTKTGNDEVYGLLRVGLDANKPAPGIAGRFYWARDSKILYRDTGPAWEETARGETATRLAQLAEKAHGSLTGITSDQHHARYTDTEAQSTVKSNVEVGDLKAPTKALSMNNQKVTDLAAPASDLDALPRGMVDVYGCDHGLNWADLGVIASGTIWSMAYLGNGIAILGDHNYRVYRSTDYGATWTNLGVIATAYISSMANLGNGIAIMGDENGYVFRSTDYGATWTDLGKISSNPTGFSRVGGLTYLGDGIVIFGDYEHVYRSTDYGASWTDLGAIASAQIYAMAYLGNGIAILGGGTHVYRSMDYGATWADLGVIASGPIHAMAYLGNGIAILGDDNYRVYRSADYGGNWTDLGVIASGPIYAMAYLGNGIAILGERANRVYRSTDYGATWADLGVIASGDIRAMAYLGNGIAILGDNANHVYRSTSAFQLSNFNPNQFDETFQFGCLGAITANATSFLAPGNGATQTNEIMVRVPRPGLLRNLHVWQRVASGAAGRTGIYTVRVNGVDTDIECTLDNETEGADTTNSVIVAAGDKISIKLVSNDVDDASEDVTATIELV